MKKSNLFIFGDSFSNDWETVHNMKPVLQHDGNYRTLGQTKYSKQYQKQHNKYPIHFQDIIKSEFNCEHILNYSGGGYCNYSILDSIGKYIKLIKENDIVLIGWSSITRWRFIEPNTKKWRILYPNTKKEFYPAGFYEQILHRDTSLTMQEIRNWQYILLKSLPKNTLFWSPFVYDGDEHPYTPFEFPDGTKIESIFENTNGKIDDYHYSENGMKSIGDWLVKLIKDNPYRKPTWL